MRRPEADLLTFTLQPAAVLAMERSKLGAGASIAGLSEPSVRPRGDVSGDPPLVFSISYEVHMAVPAPPPSPGPAP